MDLYIFCVVLGAAGMAAMAFLGFTSSHGGGHQSHDTSGHEMHGIGAPHGHSITPSHGHVHGHEHAHELRRESRRRQSAAEAQANADIVTAQQARRAKEAQLEAERVISDKQRELEQTKASNAALIAEAEAKKQTALGIQRVAELEATQIAQARADAEKMRIDAEARANAEAIRITTVAQANAESIQKVNEAIKAGGESYFRYRQIEMIPQIAPVIAEALSRARLVTISGDSAEGGAAQSATSNITSVIQTVLAAQLVSNAGVLQQSDTSRENGRQAVAPVTQPAPASGPAKTGFK